MQTYTGLLGNIYRITGQHILYSITGQHIQDYWATYTGLLGNRYRITEQQIQDYWATYTGLLSNIYRITEQQPPLKQMITYNEILLQKIKQFHASGQLTLHFFVPAVTSVPGNFDIH